MKENTYINEIEKIFANIVANEINFYNADLPSDVELDGKELIADYGKIFLIIFVMPMFFILIYIQDIGYFIAKLMHISKESSNFELFIWLVVLYMLYGVTAGVLLWGFYKYVKKFHQITLTDQYFQFKDFKVSIDKILRCRPIGEKVKIEWEGKSGFWVKTLKMRNEAAAYALCLKIKNLKRKNYEYTKKSKSTKGTVLK